MLEAEWDQDLTILVPQNGVLEYKWDLDGKGIGEERAAEVVDDATLLGLGSSGPAPPCMCASLWDNGLVAWVWLPRRKFPSLVAPQDWSSYNSGP